MFKMKQQFGVTPQKANFILRGKITRTGLTMEVAASPQLSLIRQYLKLVFFWKPHFKKNIDKLYLNNKQIVLEQQNK